MSEQGFLCFVLVAHFSATRSFDSVSFGNSAQEDNGNSGVSSQVAKSSSQDEKGTPKTANLILLTAHFSLISSHS